LGVKAGGLGVCANVLITETKNKTREIILTKEGAKFFICKVVILELIANFRSKFNGSCQVFSKELNDSAMVSKV
jgi:hypothetical protein